MIKRIILLLSAFSAFFLSCDKNKRFSARIDDNKWQVTEISADGKSEENLPKIKFNHCEIYDEPCDGSWSSFTGKAKIVWQFRDDGKTFEFSNQTDHAHDQSDLKAAEQCIRFTGVYRVVKLKRKYMELSSTAANGYPGKTVIIKMERE